MSITNQLPVQVMLAGNMASATLTSSNYLAQYLDNIGIQLTWSGSSPVGTVGVNYSLDSLTNPPSAPTNWIAYPLDPQITVSGNTGTAGIELIQITAQWIQVVYTKTSGTGSLSIVVNGKRFGA